MTNEKKKKKNPLRFSWRLPFVTKQLTPRRSYIHYNSIINPLGRPTPVRRAYIHIKSYVSFILFLFISRRNNNHINTAHTISLYLMFYAFLALIKKPMAVGWDRFLYAISRIPNDTHEKRVNEMPTPPFYVFFFSSFCVIFQQSVLEMMMIVIIIVKKNFGRMKWKGGKSRKRSQIEMSPWL